MSAPPDAARRAAALRENLRRRKAQARDAAHAARERPKADADPASSAGPNSASISARTAQAPADGR
jgi:hypothetical protein